MAQAHAAEDILKVLEARGFLPWAADFTGEIAYTTQPEPDEFVLGSAYLVRLPEPAKARQILVAWGDRSVIVDRLDEVGPFGLSLPAARALGLTDVKVRTPVTLQVIALLPRQARPGVPIATIAPPFVASPESKQPGRTAPAQPPAPTPRPPIAVVTKPSPVTGGYALQAGLFGVETNARRLSVKLHAQTIPTIVIPEDSPGGPRWRVLAGPFASEAERDSAKIRGGDLLKSAYPVNAPE